MKFHTGSPETESNILTKNLISEPDPENFFSAFSIMGVIAWEIDLASKSTRWLASTEIDIPQAGKNITFKNCLKVIHPDDRNKFAQSARALLQNDVKMALKLRITTTTGDSITGYIHCAKQSSKDGSSKIIGMLQNLSNWHDGDLNSPTNRNDESQFVTNSVFPLAIHRKGKLVHINSLACKAIGGMKTTDFIGKNIFEFLHPDFHDIITSASIPQNQSFDSILEQKFIRIDGSVIDVEVINSKIIYKGEKATQVLFRDITDRKQNEILHSVLFNISQATTTAAAVSDLLKIIHREISRLMDARNFFTAIYEAKTDNYSFPYFVDEYDPAPNFPIKILKTSMTDYVRRHGKAMLIQSAEREKLIQDGIIDRVGHDPKIWMGIPFHIMKNVVGVVVVQSYTDELCYSTKDLEVLTFVSQHIAFSLQKKRVEEKLRFHELRYRALTEKVQDLVLIFSKEGECLYASPSVEHFGHKLEQIIDQPLFNFIDRNDYKNAVKKLRAINYKDNQSVQIDELRVRCQNGDIRMIEGVMTILLNQPGVHGIVFTGRDITERKRDFEEKKKLERQMQHTQKLESLGILAGGIAHDFNNLLVAVLGNADLVLSELDSNSLIYENIKDIEKAAFRAADLCKQMLAYSGRGNFIITDLNLSAIIKDMMQMLDASRSKKAIIKLNINDSIPSVRADITQLRQVILNLITNASDALEDEVGVISISTGHRFFNGDFVERNAAGNELMAGNYVFLQVQDTGCGMDAKTISKLFDPFFTTKFTGRGLGLSAVLGIMRGHNGGIVVESNLQKGSTFTVLFPPVLSSAAKMTESPSRKKAIKQGQGTILVVDDEKIVRDMARKILSRMGYSIVEAADGIEAIEYVHDNYKSLNCILLDLTMPKMDGKQVIDKIREYTTNIPVILTSGYSELEVSQHFEGENISGFLQKPFSVEELMQIIGDVIS
ncbi:MAG: PAS domain S-box protein [Calditrichaeota bacterium]|nr:MAG: PAS domain S-box protein [Calditrichota bacterium]